MAFNPFKRDFSKPGPGVPKNAPRKTGIPRFFEILGRDFGNLVKLNLLVALCMLPALLLFGIGVLLYNAGGFFWGLVFGLGALLLSFPIGPALTAMVRILTKMLCDTPGFVWHDFKRYFKENFRSMLLPGMLFSALAGAQLFALLNGSMLANAGIVVTAMFFLSVLLLLLIWPYFYLQAAYLELGLLPRLQNSVALSLGFLPRSAAGGLLFGALVVAQVLFFPLTLPILLFIGITLPALICMMWTWPPTNKSFNIEETLKKRHDEQFDVETEVQE